MSMHITSTACPKCSTSGNGTSLAVYEDGSFCHECGLVIKEQGEVDMRSVKMKTKKPLPLVPIGEFKEIKSRGISKDVCEKYKYSWTQYRDELVQCASFMSQGVIISQKLRTQDKKFVWLGDKSKVMPLYGMEFYQPNPKLSITVCEGELDTLSWRTNCNDDWPIVGLLDGAGPQGIKSIAKAKEFLNGYKKIVFMFDGDEAGRSCAEECAKMFPGKGMVANMPDGEDVCSMIKQGRSKELSKIEMRASAFKPKDIVTISDYSREELYSKEAVGVPLPYPALNNLLRGLKRGRLYTFCAGSGMGKSTIVKEIAYHLMFNEGIRVGSIFLEQDDREAMRDYIAMHCNIEAESFSEDPNRADSEEREAAEDILADKGVFYKHFGSLSTDTLISKMEYLMLASECDYVILDHISMAVSGIDASGNERKDIDILMTKLRSLIQQTNKTVIAVVHLKRPSEARGSFSEGATVSLSDLRGSASLEQISDFVVALERDQFDDDEDKQNQSKVKVLKSRRGGKVGYADLLKYNYETGRLLVNGRE